MGSKWFVGCGANLATRALQGVARNQTATVRTMPQPLWALMSLSEKVVTTDRRHGISSAHFM
jgi:hypothetical protein